jgi:DNA-binding transcriptional MerR regulator
MANVTITDLPVLTIMNDADVIPVVNVGTNTTQQISGADLKTYFGAVTPAYGQFWSNISQTVASANTEYRFAFNNTDAINGNIALGSGAKGVRTHILRYWEEQFPMLKPLTRAGGRRLYRPEDVALLHSIHRLLYEEGYTVKGARRFLTEGGAQDAQPHAPSPEISSVAALDFGALQAVRERLATALAAA